MGLKISFCSSNSSLFSSQNREVIKQFSDIDINQHDEDKKLQDDTSDFEALMSHLDNSKIPREARESIGIEAIQKWGEGSD